jgi:hypothetical protein
MNLILIKHVGRIIALCIAKDREFDIKVIIFKYFQIFTFHKEFRQKRSKED